MFSIHKIVFHQIFELYKLINNNKKRGPKAKSVVLLGKQCWEEKMSERIQLPSPHA